MDSQNTINNCLITDKSPIFLEYCTSYSYMVRCCWDYTQVCVGARHLVQWDCGRNIKNGRTSPQSSRNPAFYVPTPASLGIALGKGDYKKCPSGATEMYDSYSMVNSKNCAIEPYGPQSQGVHRFVRFGYRS